MKTQFVALALAALAAVALAEDAASDVVVLTDETYKQAIKDNAYIMIEFYAPWCGHCKALAPEYEKAATALKGIAVIAKIDATANEEAAQANEIRGFPTVRLFINGNPSEYQGPRTAEAIAAFVKKAMEPAIVVLHTAEEIPKFKKDHPVAVVAEFPSIDEAAAATEGFSYAAYKAAAESDKMSSGPSYAVLAGLSDKVVVTLYRASDDASFVYDPALYTNAASFVSWAKAHGLPALDEISGNNYRDYVELKLPLLWLTLNTTADNTAIKATVEKVAKEFVGKALFVWLDANKFTSQPKAMGLSGKVFPALVATNSKNLRFVFEETKALEEEAIRKFVEDILADKIAPFMKSAEAPEDNEAHDVFEVVGKTFKAVSSDATKDVLIEFYASYCGHCKALAPVYEELGRVMKSVKTLRIARLNVPDNDIEGVEISGFPTIMLFPSGENKTAVTYEGDRTLSSFVEFLQKNAKTAFELPEEAKKAIEPKEEKEEEEAAEEPKEKEEL